MADLAETILGTRQNLRGVLSGLALRNSKSLKSNRDGECQGALFIVIESDAGSLKNCFDARSDAMRPPSHPKIASSSATVAPLFAARVAAALRKPCALL